VCRIAGGRRRLSVLLELVAGEEFDSLGKGGAAPEAWPDLGVSGPAVTPAEHSLLQRAETATPGTDALGPRESGHGDDPSDHVWAAPEATGDVGLVDALIDQPEDSTLEGPQASLWVTHGSSVTGVAAQAALILVKEMWHVAQ
jgi:hypothetical protein